MMLSYLPKDTQITWSGDKTSDSMTSQLPFLSLFPLSSPLPPQSTKEGPGFPVLVCPAITES